MEKHRNTYYKYCFVPMCPNNVKTAPDKKYFLIPKGAIRKKWCKAMRRINVSCLSCLYCCEDHFNIEKDTENYMQYKIMALEHGQKVRLRLKKGVVPNIFQCQKKDKLRPPPERNDMQRKRQAQDLLIKYHQECATTSETKQDTNISNNATAAVRKTEYDDTVEINSLDEARPETDNATAAVIKTEYDDTVKINSLEEARPETDIQALNNDKEDLHDGYKCDMCKGPIYRFRYSCVECANYDLCGACEARAAHSQHYLLRIPRPRPHGEIQIIMDTIRRFLTADLKSLRNEANFVNTLMDEMKSEVLSEAGSYPVPDEPDYPIVSEHSSDEHDCEMDESNDHTSITQDDAQGVTNLDKDILQEWEFPHEIYNTETIENDVDRDSHSRTNVQDEHVQHKPKRLIVNKIDRPSSSNTLGKVSKRILVTYPKMVSIGNAVLKHKPEGSLVNKIHRSPNILRKVTKKIFVTCLKKHPMSTDVVKLKSKNDGDETQATMKTSQPSVQRKVPIHSSQTRVIKLSKEELTSAAVRQIDYSNI